MKVKIELMTMTKATKILINGNDFFVNGRRIDAEVEKFLNRLFIIIASWKNRMVNISALDADTYSVFVEDGNLKQEFFGKGEYPRNYREFIKLLDEVV